jgi:hypothetical protein
MCIQTLLSSNELCEIVRKADKWHKVLLQCDSQCLANEKMASGYSMTRYRIHLPDSWVVVKFNENTCSFKFTVKCGSLEFKFSYCNLLCYISCSEARGYKYFETVSNGCIHSPETQIPGYMMSWPRSLHYENLKTDVSLSNFLIYTLLYTHMEKLPKLILYTYVNPKEPNGQLYF